MKKLTVNVNDKYDILIERGIIENCGEFIKNVKKANNVVIVTDTNVEKYYLETVKRSLEKSGFNVNSFVFKAGEESKTTKTVIDIVEFLAQNELTRDDIVVALGGGVCGDMAGFAAAIYLRGIDFVQIPTSLLAQIDSSVGGKTATDLPSGKNLCGAFHQPILVLIDPNTLDTLPQYYFNDGMGEAIKYGCIKSKSLFERIENENAKDFIEDLIFECVDIKRIVVENDEKEKGERALLNFGHTAGHSIEKLHNFSGVSHGEAVGIGMALITEKSEKAGLTEKGTTKRIVDVLKKYDLKITDENSVKDIVESMKSDKKRTGNGIKLIMLKSIGESFIQFTDYSDIKKLFEV